MRTFYAAETEAHAPEFFLLRGRPAANEERAERALRLLAGVAAAGLAPEEPAEAPGAAFLVHTPRYLDFLLTAHHAWRLLPGAGLEVVGNVQPRRPEASYPAGIVGRAGWHMGDLACPVGERTGRAALRAVDCAAAAAEEAAAGRNAFALCRPPGHHAHADMAAGHCFLNNAAVAAALLARRGARPAILDIDVHHGNGTQAIFYERADVLFVSVHADPHVIYPWFVGHPHERGAGAGDGFNRNIVLPLGAGDEAWLPAVDEGLAEVLRFGADVLVLSLGLDVHVSDPFRGMSVSTDGLRCAGERVAAAGLPTAIVQEGGYLSDALGDNLAAFLAGFLGGQR
jgi:acetoin utilization deacetylase AcuC-like enzyme